MAKLLLCLFSLWPNLFMLKQKSLPLPRNLALSTFGELIKVFSAEVNVLLLLYLMVQRCVCYLLEQICLLKPLPRTPILMASVSLYQLSHFYQLLYANKTKVFTSLKFVFHIFRWKPTVFSAALNPIIILTCCHWIG